METEATNSERHESRLSSDSEPNSDDASSKPTQWLATGRAKRTTAGNRMKSMLAAEEPDDDLELLFAEDEDDQGFTDAGEDAGDEQMDSSSDGEDENNAHDNNLEGERELEKQAQEAKAAARKRKANDAIPAKFRKRVRIKATVSSTASTPATPTSAASAPRAKRKSERASWLPSIADMPTRASSRQTTRLSKEQLHAQMEEREAKRLKQLERMQKKAAKLEALKKPPKTQEERLREAAIVEKHNSKSLNRWELAEKQREEERKTKLAALNQRTLKGPVITFWSGTREWNDIGPGQYVVMEERPKKKRSKEKATDKTNNAADAAAARNVELGEEEQKTGEIKADSQRISVPQGEVSATEDQPMKDAPVQHTALDEPGKEHQLEATMQAPVEDTELPKSKTQESKNGNLSSEERKPVAESAAAIAENNAESTEEKTTGESELEADGSGKALPLQPSLSTKDLAASTPVPESKAPSSDTEPSSVLAAPALGPHTEDLLGQKAHLPLNKAPQHNPTMLADHATTFATSSDALTQPASQDDMPSLKENGPVSESSVVHVPTGELRELSAPTPALAEQTVGHQREGQLLEQTGPKISTRNAIIYQNFNEHAIKDKNIQTQILFGRKMIRIAKPSAPPICVITHHPARYRDPQTGLPYHNAYAYREIRRLTRGEYRWSRLLGAWSGDGKVAAKGVPARFLDPAAKGPKQIAEEEAAEAAAAEEAAVAEEEEEVKKSMKKELVQEKDKDKEDNGKAVDGEAAPTPLPETQPEQAPAQPQEVAQA